MDRRQLLQRLLSIQTGISTVEIMRRLARGDAELIDALGKLSELPIYIDHTPAISVAHVRNTARKLSAQHPIDLWVIDYLQLASSGDTRADFDDQRRVSAVSAGLMAFAREQRKPVLALSQLVREVEKRSSNVPKLSDLRGSGSLEQDASQVWFIYREELYDDESDKRGIAEIIVEKHRGGPTGVAPLYFERRTTAFHSLKRRSVLGGDNADQD
jgi:replicative DNA helicase